MQKGSCQEFSIGPLVYDSYSLETKDSIANFHEGWSIGKWVAEYQQQDFLEKSKAKKLNSVCGCPNQGDIGQQTALENKEVANFLGQFYDPVADYITIFLGQ